MKYVALLRGIMPANPNMRNEKLRGVFEKLGFENVQTVISSGNVLFESPSKDEKTLESMIEEALPQQLGFYSTTIIRSHKDLHRLISKDPFKGIQDAPSSRLSVTFLKRNPTTQLKFPYRVKDRGYTVLGIHDRAIFSFIDLTGATTPDLMLWIEKQFGKEITTRTWKTVGRILNRFGAELSQEP